MKTSTVKKPLGCLLFVILLLVIIDCFTDVIETNIIKKIDPTHKTGRETAEEEAKKQAEIAKKEAKRIANEIALENTESLKLQQVWTHFNEEKIEKSLKKNKHNFDIVVSSGFYALDNFIWIFGNLWLNDPGENHFYPAIAISENGGDNFKLSKIFYGFEDCCHSHIFFLDKNRGYLSIYNGYFITYETNDGGYTWDEILNTKNANQLHNMGVDYVKRTRVADNNICLITSLQTTGFSELIESNDGGKSWTYKRDGKEVTKTFDRGLTWEAVKSKK